MYLSVKILHFKLVLMFIDRIFFNKIHTYLYLIKVQLHRKHFVNVCTFLLSKRPMNE